MLLSPLTITSELFFMLYSVFNIVSSWFTGTILLFIYISFLSLINTSMFFLTTVSDDSATGSFIFKAPVISMVLAIIKIISSTNTTSVNGVMFISENSFESISNLLILAPLVLNFLLISLSLGQTLQALAVI